MAGLNIPKKIKSSIRFPRTLTKWEFRAGLIYFGFHVCVLPWILQLVFALLYLEGFEVTDIMLNAALMFIGYFSLIIILRNYLIDNFDRFLNWLPFNIVSIAGGIISYYALFYFLSLVIVTVTNGNIVNPNNDQIVAMTKDSLYPSIALTVLLAPIVEECLFRGIIFCGIGTKSKFLAYTVSTLLFALSHVYQYMITDFSPALFITFIMYLPSGIVLGRAYERSGTIWCSIFIHMSINLTSIMLIAPTFS